MGPQADSKKRNKPNYAFGTSQRFATGELRKSAAAPGPGSYAMPKAVETQQEPTKSMAVLYLLLHLLYCAYCACPYLLHLLYCAYCACLHSRCLPTLTVLTYLLAGVDQEEHACLRLRHLH